MKKKKKTGILTNGEQDIKIFELYKEVELQNNRLKTTNDHLEGLSIDIKEVCKCLKEQDKRIQKLETEVSRHSVWVSIITIGFGVLLTQFITRVWSIVGR